MAIYNTGLVFYFAKAIGHMDLPGWSRGVTASTLDPESSDRDSNPRETLFLDDNRRAES